MQSMIDSWELYLVSLGVLVFLVLVFYIDGGWWVNIFFRKANQRRWKVLDAFYAAYDAHNSAGSYISGHPALASSIMSVQIAFRSGVVYLVDSGPTELAQIPLEAIVEDGVTIEGTSTVQSRITFTRALDLGWGVVLLQKWGLRKHYILSVRWKEGKHTHMAVFEFLGRHSEERAEQLQDEFIKQIGREGL